MTDERAAATESGWSWRTYLTGAGTRLARLCAFGLIVAVVLHWLAPFNRIAETTTHFVTWYAMAGVVGTALALTVRARWVAGVCALGTVHFLVLLAPWYIGGSSGADAQEPNLVVVSANVHSINEHAEALMDFVDAAGPDVVFVQELSPMVAAALGSLRKDFPYHVERTRSDHFGIGLYSKRPLANAEIIALLAERRPLIRAQIEVNGRVVTLFNVHPVPPLTEGLFKERNAQLMEIARLVNESEGLAVVAGDLNITMWSPYYKRFARDAGLKNTRRGNGVNATWPEDLPFFRIPLDHIMASPEIAVLDFVRGPGGGSDHLPLAAALYVPSLAVVDEGPT